MRDPIKLSELGFGCASVLGKVGKVKAMRAMTEAFDLGVTHFDVARSYGFGRAEYVVGQFIKGRRDKLTVTSKFGVVPPQLNLRTRVSIPAARMAAKLFPQLKAKLKSKSGQLLAARNFDVAYARQCLDTSLAALATDYIDIYLIHEPDRASLENPEALESFLENSVCAGKIRRWGVAYQSVQDHEWAGNLTGDVIQFEGNTSTLPDCGSLLNDARQRIVTRPFIGGIADLGGLHSILQELKLLATVQAMGASLADVSLCLARNLAGQSGAVLCAMFSSAHIVQNIFAMKRFASDPAMNKVIMAVRQDIERDGGARSYPRPRQLPGDREK